MTENLVKFIPIRKKYQITKHVIIELRLKRDPEPIIQRYEVTFDEVAGWAFKFFEEDLVSLRNWVN